MNILLIFVLLLTAGSTGDSSAPLPTPNPIPLKKDTTLVLYYNVIACSCAQWTEDRKGFPDSTTQFYYLKPANKKLVEADDLWDGMSLPLAIKVTGQIISYAGYPKDYQTKGKPEPANVFRYTNIKVVKKGKPVSQKKS